MNVNGTAILILKTSCLRFAQCESLSNDFWENESQANVILRFRASWLKRDFIWGGLNAERHRFIAYWVPYRNSVWVDSGFFVGIFQCVFYNRARVIISILLMNSTTKVFISGVKCGRGYRTSVIVATCATLLDYPWESELHKHLFSQFDGDDLSLR